MPPPTRALRLLALVLLAPLAVPAAQAQWEKVPLPPQIVSPAQVALFGFAEAFGGSLFVSTGFGIPQTPSSPVYDHVFVTHDGGATWAAVPEFTFDITNSGFQIGRPTVADGALYLPRWISNGRTTPNTLSSTVLKTTDGRTWSTPASAGLDAREGPLLNVARQAGVLYGHTGRTATTTSGAGFVYRSTDEGATWARAGAERQPGLLWAAGARLLLGLGQNNTAAGERSADGGATWTPYGSPILSFARNTSGVVLTSSQFNVQRSTDGGVTSAQIPSTTFGFGGTFALGACKEAFVAVALQGGVKRSDDGGTTWTLWSDGLPEAGANVRMVSCSAGGPSASGPTYVYAAVSGNSGSTDAGVYRRDLAQRPVASEADLGTADVALAIAPNPARGRVRLAVTLREASAVRLSVVDALGREVAVVVDGGLSAGAHSLPLDTSPLVPGLYVVRLATPTGVASARLTVAH